MEDVIVEALLSNEREAQVVAARELGKLESKLRHKLAERGIISRLVMMLHTQDYEAIEAALLALLSLAYHSDRNKVRIANSGAIQAILKIIQFQNQSLIELGVAALLILSSCTANKPAIAASGAIELLLASLNSKPESAEQGVPRLSMQAKIDVLSMCHNVSTSTQLIPSIVSSGVVCAMVQLIYLFEKSSGLVEKAMALLEKVVLSSSIALKEVAETAPVVIQLLVEAIEEGTPQCKEHAVGTLLVLCQSCRDRYRGMILREGAIPGLLQLSVDGTLKSREKAKALLQLLRDCSDCYDREKQSKDHLLELEQVMRQIDRGGNGYDLRLVEEMIAKLRP